MLSILVFLLIMMLLGAIKMPRYENEKVVYKPFYKHSNYYKIFIMAPILVILFNIIFFQQLVHFGGIVMVLVLIYGSMKLSKFIFEKYFMKYMDRLGLIKDIEA